MTKEMISEALEAEGIKGTGGVHVIGEDRDATCYVSTPGDLLNVARVVKVDLRGRFLGLQTAKDEHYFFAYEAVLGFRLAGGPAGKERATGFAR